MIRRRPGTAVLALAAAALAPLGAAAGPPGEEQRGDALLVLHARAAGGELKDGAREAPAPAAAAQTRPSGPVFMPGGIWARAEAAFLVGGQRVSQDLGLSRNIFQTVTAAAEDVGFGEHYGARGAVFFTRYLGVEAGFTRTTTEFEIEVEDAEAGLTIFDEGLIQRSREAAASIVAQIPLAALTPYVSVGYGWRESEVEGEGSPYRGGAFLIGGGFKVPFPLFPAALAFDYRYVRYSGPQPLEFTEGGGEGAAVAALTLGILIRFGEQE